VPPALQLRARCNRTDEPAWLKGQALVCPLLGILRAPQIEGYRNKAEFTCGYSETGEPTVGFLLGSYSVSAYSSSNSNSSSSSSSSRGWLRTRAGLG
jgi:hypothetical protein